MLCRFTGLLFHFSNKTLVFPAQLTAFNPAQILDILLDIFDAEPEIRIFRQYAAVSGFGHIETLILLTLNGVVVTYILQGTLAQAGTKGFVIEKGRKIIR